MFYLTLLEQNNSPLTNFEVKKREEERLKYYNQHKERIEENQKNIQEFNKINKDRYDKSEYKYGYFNYNSGLQKCHDMWKDRYDIILKKLKNKDTIILNGLRHSYSYTIPRFNFTSEDSKYGFVPELKHILLSMTSTLRGSTFRVDNQLTSLKIPSPPSKKGHAESKKTVPTVAKKKTSRLEKRKTPEQAEELWQEKQELKDLKNVVTNSISTEQKKPKFYYIKKDIFTYIDGSNKDNINSTLAQYTLIYVRDASNNSIKYGAVIGPKNTANKFVDYIKTLRDHPKDLTYKNFSTKDEFEAHL